jgi:EpsI family protein
MTRRRDFLIGGLTLTAAGVAEALRPRKRLVLLRKGTIAQAMPTTFGAWTAEGSTGLVSPEQAGRLARTLYSEIVQRVYSQTHTGAEVMVLAAYGDTQSDLLQLHRPESCYPAVGFNIASSKAAQIPIGGGAAVPGRRVVAVTEDRRENIVYWTRIGESLPQTASEQRNARFSDAVHGYVSDGILFRCSVLGDSERAFRVLDEFVPAVIASTTHDQRPALIGDRLAKLVA